MHDLLHRIGLDPDRLLFGNPVSDWLYALGLVLKALFVLMASDAHVTLEPMTSA